MSDQVKVQLNQVEGLPFSHEEIFATIAENIEEINTESDETCLLVNEKMAIFLFWEGDKIIVEKVIKASELQRSDR